MAALIKLPCPSPFSFPGGNPGFDPSHMASQGIVRLSAVSVGGSFVNLLNGNPGTVTGVPTKSVDGSIGPATAITSSNNVTFATSAGTDPHQTIAGIFRLDASTNGGFLLSASSGVNFGMRIVPTNELMLYIQGQSNFSTFSLSNNAPFFAAISNCGAVANFILVNLSTGLVQTGTVSSIPNNLACNGTMVVGNQYNLSNTFYGKIAAVAYSTASLSVPQLLRWAQDPWSFWYP